MSFLFHPAKPAIKRRRKNAEGVLEKLQGYLNDNSFVVIEMLCVFWKDQQDAVTYQELREAVISGVLTEELWKLWSQDYSVLVTDRLHDVWQKAMEAGSKSPKILQTLPFEFDMYTPGVTNWINERGAEFVTSLVSEQKKAIQSLLAQKVAENHTTDELARFIRPCIGLTDVQAKANLRYYDSIVRSLKEDHPKMKQDSIRKKAREASAKYAERQHRQRAATIAQTEMAFAYNRGADESVRQAQEENLLGTVKKRWSTSGDSSVCDICLGLEGTEIDMDAEFDFKGKVLFAGQKLMPPAHARCACAVEYIEVSPPIFTNVPQMDISIMERNSFKEYSDEEISSIAKQTEAVVSKHIAASSRWSGNIQISDKGIKDDSGRTVHYGKLWNCDIVTKHYTAPGVILHEQIHARSVSHYSQNVYSEYQNIEEASVQFMVQEISQIEKIEIIDSAYDDMVDNLRKIRLKTSFASDYDFAKKLIETPLPDRLNWLSNMVYATMSLDKTATIEEYIELSEMLNTLY